MPCPHSAPSRALTSSSAELTPCPRSGGKACAASPSKAKAVPPTKPDSCRTNCGAGKRPGGGSEGGGAVSSRMLLDRHRLSAACIAPPSASRAHAQAGNPAPTRLLPRHKAFNVLNLREALDQVRQQLVRRRHPPDAMRRWLDHVSRPWH
eukprot:scaffold5064_cov115-Isochrysis_galbana.AAC.14